MDIAKQTHRAGFGAILAAIVALLSACASSGGSEQTSQMLSGAEIREVIAGNTVVGSMADGTEYAEFYAADGTVRGADYTGDWTIDGDRMCFDYPAGETCYRVAVEGDTVSWMIDGEVKGTGTLREGNPKSF